MNEYARTLTKVIVMVTTLAGLLPATLHSREQKQPLRPNIIYLHVHDMGRYCQPYGHAVPTPNIQRLAEEGVLFHQFHAAAPTCSPSRAAMLTGQYPHSCGMLGLAHRGVKLFDYKHHIIHTLKKAGYHSVLIGGQHVAPQTELIGYDEVIKHDPKSKEHYHIQTTASAIKWLKEPTKQPFFAAIGYGLTHRGFVDPRPPDDPRYTMPPAPLPNTPTTRRDMASFNTHARVLDQVYGQLFDTLKENGLYESSLIIC
ncbi:MAG: sulfatase-like hydrolase/transferase, partial [Planctomycetota bacterium]